MTMVEFMERFNTEEKCREYLYKTRWPEGFVCPHCGAKAEPFRIKSRNRLQCRHCMKQTSVTVGTILEKSRTPLVKWFLAIYMMSQDKRGCSAKKLQRDLGVAYDTAWTMSHKIRHAMGERDSLCLLEGTVEMDDAFFGGSHAGGKRGRGTDKTPVIFAVSLDENGRPRYVNAQVAAAVNGENLARFAKEHIKPGSVIHSDGLAAYGRLGSEGYRLQAENFDLENSPAHLKWLHIIVSNAKAFILGTFHGLNDTHLQAYFDEFCYRVNRRWCPEQLFARSVLAAVSASPFSRYALIG